MTTEEVGTDPQPNWRDLSSYDYTRNLMREDWAWEFLRRNSGLRRYRSNDTCGSFGMRAEDTGDPCDRPRQHGRCRPRLGVALSAKRQTAPLVRLPSSGGPMSILPFFLSKPAPSAATVLTHSMFGGSNIP